MAEKTTTCVDCGKVINYATKKPKWCKGCKSKKPKHYRKPKKNIPQHSQKERQMQKILNLIFPEASYIDNGYYSFLPSPKGHPMQLDRYYPRLKIAWEFDGAQHKSYNPFMHKSKEAFEYLQACDQLKDKLCEDLGIRLIRIRHDKEITQGYLIKRLQAENILEDLKHRTRINDNYNY